MPHLTPIMPPQPVLDPKAHPSDQILHDYCHGDQQYIATIEAHLAECGECRSKVLEIVRQAIQAERLRQGYRAIDGLF